MTVNNSAAAADGRELRRLDKTDSVPKKNPSGDAALIFALREGTPAESEKAFEELMTRWQTPLFNFFKRLVWDYATAEDLTQEVFMRLYRHRADYEPQATLATYLFRIGRNCWVDYLRRMRRERKNMSLDENGWENHANDERNAINGGNHDRWRSERNEPAAEISRKELSESLARAINSLSDEHRLVFVLSAVQGLSYEETAAAARIPVGTVKSRMHHAVKLLRKKLSKMDDV